MEQSTKQTRAPREAESRNVSYRPEAWRPPETLPSPDDRRFTGNIEVGGLLLCRIPDEFLAQRAAYYAKQNQAQMDSVDNNFLRDSDHRMPLFSEKKSKVTFGSGS